MPQRATERLTSSCAGCGSQIPFSRSSRGERLCRTCAETTRFRKRIAITGITRMYGDRICISGIDMQSMRFLRPVTDAGHDRSFTVHGGTQIIRHFNVVEMAFRAYTPARECHTEDWALETAVAPKLIAHLTDEEIAMLCRQVATDDLNAATVRKDRSLFIVRAERILDVWHETYNGKFKLRMSFVDAAGNVHSRFPVNDLLCLAKVQWMLEQGGNDYATQIMRAFNSNPDRYIRIGLTRLFQGRYWPQVTGIITVPDLFDGEGFLEYERLLGRHA